MSPRLHLPSCSRLASEEGSCRPPAGTHLACSSGSFLCLCMWNMRSPPLTYSMTRKSLREDRGVGAETPHGPGPTSLEAGLTWGSTVTRRSRAWVPAGQL